MKGTGGVLVATKHGVISSKRKHCWVPSDHCKVTSWPDIEAVLTDNLQKICDKVRLGTFLLAERITLQKHHQQMVGESPGGKQKCGCKKMCSGTCGCARAKVACNSSCACNRRCKNPHD